MRRTAAALAITMTTACSYVAHNGPAYENPVGTPAPDCSTSQAPVIADGVLAFIAAIPTFVGVAIAWDDPRWEYADGEPGGVQLGSAVALPWGAILTLAIFSVRYGVKQINACDRAHARAAQPSDPHGEACLAVFQAIADARLVYADPLPSWCPLAEAEAAFLLDADGRATDTFAGASLRVHVAGSAANAVEIERPRLPLHWKDTLGEPDAKLDDGTWVYAVRGLALTLSGDAVVRAIVFPPTSVAGYQAHFAPAP